MTLFRILFGFVAVTSILLSCKKDYSDEDGKIPGVLETTWEFKENGQQFNGDMDSAYFQTAGGFTALTMVGSRPQNQTGEILFQITGDNLSTGTYSNAQIFFQYSEGGNILYQTIPGQTGDFTITITELDSDHVSGTFSGTAYDPSGGSHSIVDGKFTVEVTDGYNPGPTPDGQLTVWAKEICFDGSSIEVKVQDQTGFISDAIASDPACGAQGTATFTLPQGLYTVTAICGADTLQYNINLNSTCVKLMVDFTNPPLTDDYLPLTLGSYWDYKDLQNEFTTQRTTAVSDTVLDGRLYTMLVNGLPDTAYYRKDNHVYFEYITLDFNGSVQAPPSFEVEILHDDFSIGQTWETAAVDLVLSQVPVKAKLLSRIAQRDFSASIGGVNYDNLIEVRTSLLFSADGGNTFIDSGSEIVRVFAKDIGIVYYYEPEWATEWGAYASNIVP